MPSIRSLSLINMNPNKLGALEEYAFHLCLELKHRGHFGAVGFLEYPVDWLMNKFQAEGIEILRINPANGSQALIRDVRKAIQQHKLNVIHATFYPFYSGDLLLAAIGTGCKLIYSDQESRISRPPKGLTGTFRFLKNRLYQNRIHAIIADAQFIKECQIQDLFTKSGKIPVIYNGVNLKRFRRADPGERADIQARLDVPEGSSIVVTIAQCIWAKGLNYFIDAARVIIRTRPNTIFFIVGDGPERPIFQQQALDCGLEKHVIFTGPRVDTESFLSIADVFVLLSVWEEAFAFTLLEAMASGCPVVASRIGAIPESVQDGVTGLLVPPRDAEAAAGAILTLLDDDALRLEMSRAARERVEQHFSLECWVEQTIELYENALGIIPQ